jgi:hypothetical protein
MSGYWAALIRCIGHVFQTGYGVLSVVFTAIGALKDVGDFQIIPLPSWLWWFAAVASVFFLAVRLQFRLDAKEEGVVRRLRFKEYVTFDEIGDALSQVHTAYSKEDIIDHLVRAVANREFESYTGHSRLRITHRDGNGMIEPVRPIEDGISFLNSAAGLGPTNPNVEWALYEAAISPSSNKRSTYGALTLERRDFARWYRRFLAGRYEN